jgi:hypothetical protein
MYLNIVKAIYIIYILKTKKLSTQKLLNTINSYRKVAQYKINLENSLAFLYINDEQIEKEYMETISFKIVSKNPQIPRSKFSKGCE